jgi:hypothetical protein
MTKQNVKEYLPLVQAMAEGKTIEIMEHGYWESFYGMNFKWPASHYRIKPEPTLRPWTAEEGVGKVVRNNVTRNLYLLIGWYEEDKMFVACAVIQHGSSYITSKELLKACTQLDGSPCGVEETV